MLILHSLIWGDLTETCGLFLTWCPLNWFGHGWLVPGGLRAQPVEGLNCKRPVQCLASSRILTPHPLTARRVCTPPPLVRGSTHTLGGEGGGGSIFWKKPDTVLYSTHVSTLWPNPSHYLSLSLASPVCSISPPGNALSHVMLPREYVSTVLYSTCTKVRRQLYSFYLRQLSQNP